ncbi:hypothetical protein WICPIJ_000598 [Wickerhamomyces pijperi]|uniref:Gfo/Idh/MocA-like oxidoreductase N-terminal domain-containing protein n=1 Tax=Wickerhamomyces pijperi TaxID=599730 RepID=A0A9P8TRW0_WICPI|nr:hypothetical protein WICPIJ_000598 [Wickerhamomyces pijperi]
MSSNPLRVGFVGTGIFAKDVHLPIIQSQPTKFQASAAFNRTKAKAEEFATLASIDNAHVFDSLDELLANEDVDLVDALLPVEYNLETITKAVKAGKPIIIEKPIAATLEQAREIVKLTDATPIPVVIAEQFLFFNAISKIREKLPQIGEIISFTYRSTGPFYTSNKYLATSWRRNPKHIGGFLSDGGVHQLALLTEILGLEFESISALTKQVREESGADDILFSTVKAAGGVIGTFTYGSAFGAVEKHGSLVIFGTKGSIIFDFSAGKPHSIKLQLGEVGDVPDDITIEEFEEANPPGVLSEFENLYEAVSKKDKSLVKANPRKNFHFLAIIDAALRSSKQGGTAIKVEQP